MSISSNPPTEDTIEKIIEGRQESKHNTVDTIESQVELLLKCNKSALWPWDFIDGEKLESIILKSNQK